MTTLVDARGQLCPRPLILTRQALGGVEAGAPMRVLVDNDTARGNIERFLRDHGVGVTVTREGATLTLDFAAPAVDAPPVGAPAQLPTTQRPGWVVSFAGDGVGRGPPELGAVLVKSMLAALEAVTPPPSHVVLYSSGVLLAVEGAETVAPLRALEQRGVEVLTCGTCVDWYGKRDALRVGTVSNMLSILEVLARAEKVLAP